MLIYCTGQLLYVAVPAWGPYHWLAGSFPHPLPRGPWLDTLLRTVAFGGAQKDVFPSLHTAGPVFLSLFAFRHRATSPFRYTWHATAFVAANMVFATLFLRWHYAVDVLAGALLAVAAFVASVRLPPWETARRRAAGIGPVFPES